MADWTEGLAPELVKVATDAGWKGPADVIGAYQKASAAAPDPWEGLEPEVLKHRDTKGWKSGADAARAHFAAEKLLSRPHDELVHLPKAGLTPEQRKEILARVMAPPEKPDAYDFGELKDEEGGPQLLGWWRNVAHELGFGNAEARAIAEKFGAFGAESAAASEAQATETRTKAAESLRQKHGAKFGELQGSGERALFALGISKPGQVDANGHRIASELELILEQALGPEQFFEVFAGLGAKLAEHKIVDMDGGGGVQGKAALEAELDGMLKDRAGPYWTKAHPGHAAAMARAQEINKLLHGDAPSYGPGAGSE